MIICCGEALIDMIPAPTIEGGAAGYVPHSGGAVLNTAVSLGRLGIEVAMISGISTDLFGEQLAASLNEAGVSTDLLIRSARPTTLAFVSLKDGKASYVFYDENSAGRMISPEEMPALPAVTEALYFGGISLTAEPAADSYAALCAREANSRVIMIDPNIRPGFITDETAYRQRLEKMLALADIVKISDEDLAWLMPDHGTLHDKALALCNGGATVVVLTRGAEGASAYFGAGQSLHVPAVKAEVVDTVGAGDTFNAGFLAALSEAGILNKEALSRIDPTSLSQALTHGARVAAITVSRAGANPPWKHELDA